MSTIARIIEVSSRSEKSFEDAVHVAVERATKTLRNVVSAYCKDFSVSIADNHIQYYEVNVMITFIMDDAESLVTGGSQE